MMPAYSIGIDFGTLSGRAVLVDLSDGSVLASSVYEYPHGVMDKFLPDGTALAADTALQHPADYLEVLYHTVPDVLEKSGVDADCVVGIGIDFTSCTILPVLTDGTPLCLMPEYEGCPDAYVKLWKHHSAQKYADEMTRKAKERNEAWLPYYGGAVSCESAFPKIWETLDRSPSVYEDAVCFVDAADWVVWMLCGELKRNACCAGYKYMYCGGNYPSEDYFACFDERLRYVVSEKLSGSVYSCGERAGMLTPRMAEKLGLGCNTAVSTAIIDAHVFVPACGITTPGKMLAILGTSTCFMLLSEKNIPVEGISGVVKNGILEGFYAYEAGQSAVGDSFSWFIKNCVPADYYARAEKEGMNIHEYLREKADKLTPGESGLLALDWFNGNRSVLENSSLSGLILGLTLSTKPEEIYRALIEATAFGARVISEAFTSAGLEINELYAAGGIAGKDPMMMQIYADVLNMPVRLAGSEQGGAFGSAIYGAVAADCFESVISGAEKIGRKSDVVYYPIAGNVSVYNGLYAEYKRLHDYFGRGENNVMMNLRKRG